MSSYLRRLAILAVLIVTGTSFATVMTASARTTTSSQPVPYTNTKDIQVPPSQVYAGSAGGDGWALAFYQGRVYNVFHHSTSLTMACHNEDDATACWAPVTITDPNGSSYTVSTHEGLWMDQKTGHLWVYAARQSDASLGVVCVDVTGAQPANCGYVPLTGPNGAETSWGAFSGPILIGSDLYAFNYMSGTPTSPDANTLVCFDTSTLAKCSTTPSWSAITASSYNIAGWGYAGAAANIGGDLVVHRPDSGNGVLDCYDPTTGGRCAGSGWPIDLSTNASAWGHLQIIPTLDSQGGATGFCLNSASDPCYGLDGTSAPTPAALASMIGTDVFDGPIYEGHADGNGVARIYLPDYSTTQLECYDFQTGASCPNFPQTFANLGDLYTVNPDPDHTGCLWVNSDNGSEQIQNLDAFTGGACSAIRVRTEQMVGTGTACVPASNAYQSLTVAENPAGTGSPSGTVTPEDPNGNPIPGVSPITLDAKGTASLAGLSLDTSAGAPQFVINLSATSGNARPTSLEVTLNWTAPYDASCASTNGVTATPPPPASTPTSVPTSSPSGAQVLFVHGWTQKATDTSNFESLLAGAGSAVGDQSRIHYFDYYQDAANEINGTCLPYGIPGPQGPVGSRFYDPTLSYAVLSPNGQPTPGVAPITMPTNWTQTAASAGRWASSAGQPRFGLPLDLSQNGATSSDGKSLCDSAGDVAQNAIRLGQAVDALYASNGRPIILVGYSMGGMTIRTFLAYELAIGNTQILNEVDSVLLMHGVEQGAFGAQQDWLTPVRGALAGKNMNRSAPREFDAASDLFRWLRSNSQDLGTRLHNVEGPIPLYNTYADITVSYQHCWMFGCTNGQGESWGDGILLPGNPDPTGQSPNGGAQFVPSDGMNGGYQWAERQQWQITASSLGPNIGNIDLGQAGMFASIMGKGLSLFGLTVIPTNPGSPYSHTLYASGYQGPNGKASALPGQDYVTVPSCVDPNKRLFITNELIDVLVARMEGRSLQCE